MGIIESNNKISITELKIQLAVSKSTVLRNIEKLKKNNTLERIGDEKTGRWKINQTDVRVELIIKQIKLNPEITILQLSKLINVSKSTILRTIEKLKKNKRLERIGDEKTGYWKVLK